ncbi:hypothetical protein [Chryseobacterium cucumeris]|uniref:hypothetical protein n=1 Tax=Chryseobacterium cucumeris TaxID=1813611 RepID=UPI001EE766C1|nr:hypothetical protein [Chryseobacterium cucumeris]
MSIFHYGVFWYVLNVEKILQQALQKVEITDTTIIIAMQSVDSATEQNWSIQFLKKD